MIEIRETSAKDIKNVQELWADGDVMLFVGFPEGLHETEASMQEWINGIIKERPSVNEYSIFEQGVYCGQVSYGIDKTHKSAWLDIKLFKHARGRGIATQALSYAIKQAFKNGADTV